MRVLFMGTPDFAAVSLAALYDGGFDVAGVFTQPDKPVGRKQVLTPSPVKVLAQAHGTPVYQPAKMRDGTALELARGASPDVIAVVAYGRILPVEILALPKLGCVNIHGSLLPKYRGAAPIQWAVLNGEKETGVTAQYMAQALDSGDIIDARRVAVGDGETAGELFGRLAPIGAALLCDVLRAVGAGTAARTAQDEAEATFAPPLTKEMAQIDWNKDADEIVNLVRGLNPWPVAQALIAGTALRVYAASAAGEAPGAHPGEIVSADGGGIRVAAGRGCVLLRELQAPGGKRMAAADYLRGHPILP